MATIFKQYDILLDLKRATTNNRIEVVEGDNGNIFHITLTDNGVPVDLSDTRVVAVFSNSDGTAEQDTGDTAYGEYVFVYDSVSDHWNCGIYGSDDLSDFGITLTGTPSNGDKVTVTFDEDGATATTDVSGGSVSVDAPEFARGMASVQIRGDDNNEIYVLVRAGSFSSSGINECEIQIYSGDNQSVLVTTAKYNFQSRRSSINDETIQSEEKYPILVSLISQVQEALAKALPYTSVTITAHHVNGAPTVQATITENSVAWSFGIPNGVHLGDSAPVGDEEVWIDTSGGQLASNLMTTDVYDTDEDGVVDNSEALNGHADTYFAKASDISDIDTIRSNAANGQTAYTRSTDKVLYLSAVACSSMTGDFATVSNDKITADHVVAECTFSIPTAINGDITWTTAAGELVLNGTCVNNATTANIVLIKKDN